MGSPWGLIEEVISCQQTKVTRNRGIQLIDRILMAASGDLVLRRAGDGLRTPSLWTEAFGASIVKQLDRYNTVTLAAYQFLGPQVGQLEENKNAPSRWIKWWDVWHRRREKRRDVPDEVPGKACRDKSACLCWREHAKSYEVKRVKSIIFCMNNWWDYSFFWKRKKKEWGGTKQNMWSMKKYTFKMLQMHLLPWLTQLINNKNASQCDSIVCHLFTIKPPTPVNISIFISTT